MFLAFLVTVLSGVAIVQALANLLGWVANPNWTWRWM